MESHCGYVPKCQNTNYPSPLAVSALTGIVHPKRTSPCGHFNYGTNTMENQVHEFKSSRTTRCMSLWPPVNSSGCPHASSAVIMRLFSGLGMHRCYRCSSCCGGHVIFWLKTLFTPSFLPKLGCQVFKAPRRRNTSSVWRPGIGYIPLFCWNTFLP